jgi:hypothetical protein
MDASEKGRDHQIDTVLADIIGVDELEENELAFMGMPVMVVEARSKC